jgi:hypothetical protein
VLKLALDRNLITAEEVVEQYNGNIAEVISDEVYNEFKASNNVDDSILEAIARRDLEGIELTEREKEIMQAYASDITDIQNIIEDELARDEEENAPTVESEPEETVPEIVEGEEDENGKPIDPLEGSNLMSKDEEQIQNLLQGLKPGDEVDETKEPFEVTGETESGFNVNSRDGLTVNSEPIETEEEAVNLAEGLNNTRTDIDWATVFLGNLSEDDDAKLKVSKMVRSGKASLTAYNKKNETDIKTLEEYSKIPDGKRNLDDIKEAILTDKPLSQIKAKRKKLEKQESEQIDLFEDTTSGFVGGPALPLQSVQDLFDRLEGVTTTSVSNTQVIENELEELEKRLEISKATTPVNETVKRNVASWEKQIAEKQAELSAARLAAINEASAKVAQAMSQKNTKFVSEEQVSEDTVLDQLRKINSCFK